MNKKIILIIFIIIIFVVALTLPTSKKNETIKENLLGIDYKKEGNESTLKYDTTNPVVAMYIEKYGSIVIELYKDKAPNTVNNFISLVKSGFYDNNSFHRLVKSFVLQGGDPNGNGSGGPGYSIKGEFTSNGFENNLKHEKWVVSMARSNDKDSAGSQFFICLDDASNLDGNYASFGKVIDGFSILEEIEKNEIISDQTTGKLRNNLTIKKAIVDLKNNEVEEVIKVEK